MPCSRPRARRHLPRWRRWLGCAGSVPSLPPCSGWSASSAASATDARWPPMPGWRPRLAERIGAARAGRRPVREPDAAQHHGPARMVVAAAPADLGTEPLVQGAHEAEQRPWQEGDDCRPGAQAAGRAVEVRQQWRRDRGRSDEGRLSAAAAEVAFGRALIRPWRIRVGGPQSGMAFSTALAEWSRPLEPLPPYAGCWCGCRVRRPNVSLYWMGNARTQTGSSLDTVWTSYRRSRREMLIELLTVRRPM